MRQARVQGYECYVLMLELKEWVKSMGEHLKGQRIKQEGERTFKNKDVYYLILELVLKTEEKEHSQKVIIK